MGFPTLACMELTSEEARKQSLKLVKEVSLSISWKMESFPANETHTLGWMLRSRGGHSTHGCSRAARCSEREHSCSCAHMLARFGYEGLTYKEEGLKSTHRGQPAAMRPNLPGFNFTFSQQHKTESWLTTGADGAGEEQVPSFSTGSSTHGSTRTVKKGGTRVPMTGRHGLRAIIIPVFIYTQGKSSTSVTGPRKRPSFPGLKWATAVKMVSFQKIALF